MTARILTFSFMLLLLPASLLIAADEEKTTTVKAKDLVLKAPAGWKQEEPQSNLRLTQFSIPPVEGDDEPAELSVFSFGPSSVTANVQRWISQFEAKGRSEKVTQGECEQGKYVFVDVSGTFNKPVGPPILRKTEPTADSRMLAVILEIPKKGVYYLKLTGPDKTVAAQTDSLRASFGGDAKKEKDLDLDD